MSISSVSGSVSTALAQQLQNQAQLAAIAQAGPTQQAGQAHHGYDGGDAGPVQGAGQPTTSPGASTPAGANGVNQFA
jgi:hypothetical protein